MKYLCVVFLILFIPSALLAGPGVRGWYDANDKNVQYFEFRYNRVPPGKVLSDIRALTGVESANWNGSTKEIKITFTDPVRSASGDAVKRQVLQIFKDGHYFKTPAAYEKATKK